MSDVSRIDKNTGDVLARYVQRGFRVFVVADSSAGARQLSQTARAPAQAQVVSIEELHRRLDAGNRTGIPLFDRPTVLVAPTAVGDQQAMAWEAVRAAADRSPSQVVTVDMAPPSLDASERPRMRP